MAFSVDSADLKLGRGEGTSPDLKARQKLGGDGRGEASRARQEAELIAFGDRPVGASASGTKASRRASAGHGVAAASGCAELSGSHEAIVETVRSSQISSGAVGGGGAPSSSCSRPSVTAAPGGGPLSLVASESYSGGDHRGLPSAGGGASSPAATEILPEAAGVEVFICNESGKEAKTPLSFPAHTTVERLRDMMSSELRAKLPKAIRAELEKEEASWKKKMGNEAPPPGAAAAAAGAQGSTVEIEVFVLKGRASRPSDRVQPVLSQRLGALKVSYGEPLRLQFALRDEDEDF